MGEIYSEDKTLRPYLPEKTSAKKYKKLFMWLPSISGYSYVMQCKSTSEKAVSANFQCQTKKGTVRGDRKAMETPHCEGQHTLGLVTRHLLERIC
jgi:hypothetical protein